MRKKWGIAISSLIVLCLILSSSVFAFQDINNNPDKSKIQSLQDRGIINGYNSNFNPDAKMTYAEGFQIIVKALDLNIDHIRFIKMPLASDYFTHVSDDAWYAQAFLMAQFHLEPPADIQPNDVMTREVFAHYLFKGMMTKGEFAFIELYALINDEKLVTPAYMNDIQKLLISKVVQLDANNNFRPDAAITRGEAAAMIYNGLDFLATSEPIPPIVVDKDVKIIVDKVNEDVNKVTVTWGKKPNPGYGIAIDRVEFSEDGTAYVVYSTSYPDPDRMYAQVITEPTAITYVAARYKAELMANPDQPISSSTGIDGSTGIVDPSATYLEGQSPQGNDGSEAIAE